MLASLINRIADASFPLHTRLPPERVLCEQLGVGRTTLRQALKILEADGRIWRHVGKGTFVGGRPTAVHSGPGALSTQTTLPELLEMRSVMEPQVARLAARRACTSELSLIENYHFHASRAQDWATWDRWDELFHRGIAEACGNILMISAIDQLLRIKRESRWSITRARKFDPHLRRRYAMHHDEILAAICGHDEREAEDAMRRHILSISRSIGPALT